MLSTVIAECPTMANRDGPNRYSEYLSDCTIMHSGLGRRSVLQAGYHKLHEQTHGQTPSLKLRLKERKTLSRYPQEQACITQM